MGPIALSCRRRRRRSGFRQHHRPGLYMLAVRQRLVHQMASLAVIASLGYDEVRFHVPLRPGATVQLTMEFLDKRRSGSKPDRGVVKVRFTLADQAGTVVLTHLDTLLIRTRGKGSYSPAGSAAYASS
ncbi:MAG: hypothetical protein EOO28_27645 [Comamonadaceae bacterium]|nr:MAG: hypothetical protein EOO28_27645 [Comamonadaceae bacterium]